MIENLKIKIIVEDNQKWYEWKPFNNNFILIESVKTGERVYFSKKGLYRAYSYVKAIGELYGYDKVDELYDDICFKTGDVPTWRGGKDKRVDEVHNYVKENNLLKEAEEKLIFDK